MIVAILIVGAVIAQTYNTLRGTVNVHVTAVDPLYFVGPDTWELDLEQGGSQDIIVQIGNRSQADVTVHIYLVDTPPGIYIDAYDWVLAAGVSTTFPVVIGADYPAEGDYILDVVFEPL